MLRPPQRGERPQLRGEPRVEDVGVLFDPGRPALGAGVRVLHGGELVAVRAVPHRDAVAPPELARDVPVAEAVQPLGVRVDPPLGPERDPAVEGGQLRRSLQSLHGHEPLPTLEPRFDLGVAAVAVGDRVDVGALLMDDPPHLPKALQHPGPRRVPVEAPELLRGGVGDPRLGGQDVARGEAVPAADLEVRRVVGRRDLDRAGAEFRVDRRVGHDRELPAVERVPDLPPDQVTVPFVVRMDGHARVAEHGLDPRGGAIDVAGAVGEVVAERNQLALHVPVLQLRVGERCGVPGAPVDDPLAPVDQALVVQPDEGHPHGVSQPLVHCEAHALPVAGVAHGLHLLDDPAAVLLLPLPDPLDEGLPPDLAPFQPLPRQFALHHDLGRDAGVVGAREPQGLVALHPLAPDRDVLQQLLEGVADVERPGDVRRGQDDAERLLPAVRRGVEVAASLPFGVPARLDLGGLVCPRHVGCPR